MFIRSGYSAQTRNVRSDALDSGTEHHHDARRVVIGRGDHAGAGGGQPRLVALVLELGDAHTIELDDIVLPGGLAPRPTALDDPPLALDAHDAAVEEDARGAADVRRSCDARDLLGGAEVSSVAVERV